MLFDESAFEAAFDLAQHQVETDAQILDEQSLQEAERQKGMLQRAELLFREAQKYQKSSVGEDEVFAYVGESQDVRMDHDEELQRDERREQDERLEQDEIARTAGELLERVSGDKTDKFQNSQFMSLMRRFRDREARVEGDKVVEVSEPQ